MSLPPPSRSRQRAHCRRITIEGFRRDDGLLELDASLSDVKDADYPLSSGVRPAGEPIHLMFVRITIDAEFNIIDAMVCSERVPYPGGCEAIAPHYEKLIGLNLVRGFRRAVGEMFEGVSGCSHITELLFSFPTAAIQTFASFRRETDDDGSKPFQLDRCHALETSTHVVRRYYPKWYRGADTPGDPEKL